MSLHSQTDGESIAPVEVTVQWMVTMGVDADTDECYFAQTGPYFGCLEHAWEFKRLQMDKVPNHFFRIVKIETTETVINQGVTFRAPR